MIPEAFKNPDVLTRVKSGVPLALGAVLLLGYAPFSWVATMVLVVGVIGAWEFQQMFAQTPGRLPGGLLPLASLLCGLSAVFGGVAGLSAGLLITVVLWLVHELIYRPKVALMELYSMGIGLFGLLWVVWSIQHFTLIRALSEGTALLFFLLLVISFSDIAAYFGGKRWGKTKLAPTISPKKTWEGSACGVAVATLIGLLHAGIFLTLTWQAALLLAVSTAIVGQIGDLVESKIKRLCEVKDSGALLPGHGGILDRIDGHLLAAPLFYYLMLLT